MMPLHLMCASRSTIVSTAVLGRLAERQCQVRMLAARFTEPGFFKDAGAETDLEQWFARGEHFNCVLLAPIPDAGQGDTVALDTVTDVLAETFACVKAAFNYFESRHLAGRIVCLLPHHAVMGDPASVRNSAMAGALLSFLRTTALELRKTKVTANTIMYQDASDQLGTASQASAAALVQFLLDVDAGAVNGQEIYAASAADVGRLHP